MVRKRKFTGDWLDGMLEGRELEAGLDAVSQIIGCLIVLIMTGILWLADPAWVDWKVLTTAAMVSGSRAMARRTSMQITLPEPSQMPSNGLSRKRRGMGPDST